MININNNNYKSFTWLILIFIGISVFLSYLINLFIKSINFEVPYYLDLPISGMAIYYILFGLFDKYFWKFKIFRYLGIIKSENLSGKWNGYIKSSFDEYSKEIPSELNIKQTGTSIKIYGKFNESKSCSIHENFGIDEIDGAVSLFYFYKNDPSYDATKTMAKHEGAVKLKYDKEKNELTGYYFSGRDRNNHGTLYFKR